jgi:oxygen-independent coproporphyrinogen-3 oxidase
MGVQDLNADVQQAVNRIQPFEKTAAVVEEFRQAGIEDINVDLMYGLPRQTVRKAADTVARTLTLEPDRIALFGYAHVPWMKKHMRLIDESELPDAPVRWSQFEAACEKLQEAGYVAIGMDHFARPGTPMAQAAGSGGLKRNFQGYTTDGAAILLGFGASAIGALEQGYVQNDPDVRGWRQAVAERGAATVRGRALARDDRIRRAIIERLMCDMTVDLQSVATEYGTCVTRFVADMARLDEMRRDGLVELSGTTVRMTPAGRPLVRAAAAAFDRYLNRADPATPRHARAV